MDKKEINMLSNQLIRLGIFTSDMRSACCWYRGLGPFSEIHKYLPEIQINVPSNANWASIKFNDICFFQRPMFEHDDQNKSIRHLTMCKAIKRAGKKLILDYDDDMFNIPLHNRVMNQFQLRNPEEVKAEIIETVLNCCNIADKIIVTNKALRNSFIHNGVVAEKLVIIPNAIDDYYIQPSISQKDSKNIVWRGSDTHKKDLAEFENEIIQAAKQLPDYHFHFIGDMPNLKIWNALEKKTYYEQMDISHYLHFIGNINADLCIVPLKDDEFNRAKSDVCIQEMAYNGIPSLFPAWLCSENTGILYNSKSDFLEKLISSVKNENLNVDLKYNKLSDTNQLRAKLILELL